ncbi:endogenous retrovirus group K member 7 Env polyprotein-like [Saimiri boliviensis]|uniref:endogenous retrovirus group K member 7 Env polyprotein-like n=1 Tax=Saimiri boliviensis TaxID=27679 RepID=UPI003D776767
MSLNVSDLSGPFQVPLKVNSTFHGQACVPFPYLMVSGNWSWNDTSGEIFCENYSLLQCVNQTRWRDFHWSSQSLLLTRARPDVWLPVNLTRPWSESAGVSYLFHALDTLLKRSRRFVGVLLATILGLAAVTATAAVAGVALQQSIQTADFIREWHKDSQLLWQQQRDLDAQLAIDVQNLQQAVQWLWDQLSVLSTWVALKCDWNSTHICITPVPYNNSDWEKVKHTLIGRGNLTAKILELESTITATFSKNLHHVTSKDIFESLANGISQLNPLGHAQNIVSTMLPNSTVLIIIIIVAFLVFRRWSRTLALDDVQKALQYVPSQNK